LYTIFISVTDKFRQHRTMGFKVNILCTFDLGPHGLSPLKYSKGAIESRIEALMVHLVHCPNNDCDMCDSIRYVLRVTAVNVDVIPDSLEVFSKKVREDEEEQEED